MERTEIASLYRATPADGTELTVCGWAKNIRDSKNIGFIALSDGGCFKTLQVVFEAAKLPNYEEVAHAGLYTSMRVTGRLILTPQAKQPFELNADRIEILGTCPSEDYPLQKKKMSMEYLQPASLPVKWTADTGICPTYTFLRWGVRSVSHLPGRCS